MLKTDKLLSMRRDFPEISEAAYLLYCLIVRRYEGTKLANGKGEKYITLSGSNDPVRFFGWTEGRYKRYKKELVDVKLIKIVRKGNGRPAEVYLTYGAYAESRRSKNRPSENRPSKNDPGDSLKTTRQEGLKTTRLFKDKNEIEKRNERAEPQNASPSSLTPVRFRDLENEDLTSDQKLALTALVRMEQRYNNLKKVDKWGAVNEWSAVLAGNGYKPVDMIKASELVFQHDDFQTFMPTPIRFRDFADEAKRQREEWEYNDRFFKGEL